MMNKRGGKLRGAILIVLIVLLVVVVVIWIFRGIFGSGGGGGGKKDGRSTAVAKKPSEPKPKPISQPEPKPKPKPRPEPEPQYRRPLMIQIDGHDYRVGPKTVGLDQIAELTKKIPPGDGPEVQIERLNSSRVTAENALEKILRELKVKAVWDPPL